MASPPDPSQGPPAGLDRQEAQAWAVQYGPALRRFFGKRAGAAEAEDLMQEVFLRLQARASGEAIEDAELYLFRIANNVLVSRSRYAALHHRADLHDDLDAAFEAADELSPERALIGKQMLGQLGAALRELPPRTREAFFFHRFEEMTYPAIARRMGISVVGVEKLIKRALAQLAAKVEARR